MLTNGTEQMVLNDAVYYTHMMYSGNFLRGTNFCVFCDMPIAKNLPSEK